MAEGSFAAHEVLDKLLTDSEGDFLRDALTWLLNRLMDADVSAQIGAALHERSPDRTTHRNGYRSRARDTRAGTVSLKIPELRKGTYQPPFLEPHRRSERALYTKAGMHVHHRDDIHELELRPGREIATIG